MLDESGIHISKPISFADKMESLRERGKNEQSQGTLAHKLPYGIYCHSKWEKLSEFFIFHHFNSLPRAISILFSRDFEANRVTKPTRIFPICLLMFVVELFSKFLQTDIIPSYWPTYLDKGLTKCDFHNNLGMLFASLWNCSFIDFHFCQNRKYE